MCNSRHSPIHRVFSRIRLQRLALGAAEGRCMSDIKRNATKGSWFMNLRLFQVLNPRQKPVIQPYRVNLLVSGRSLLSITVHRGLAFYLEFPPLPL